MPQLFLNREKLNQIRDYLSKEYTAIDALRTRSNRILETLIVLRDSLSNVSAQVNLGNNVSAFTYEDTVNNYLAIFHTQIQEFEEALIQLGAPGEVSELLVDLKTPSPIEFKAEVPSLIIKKTPIELTVAFLPGDEIPF